MSGGNPASIPVRSLVGATTARATRKLDEEHGFTSAFLTKCGACGGELEFDTDRIGRSIDRCTRCRRVQLVSAPTARPEGDGYSHYSTQPRRRTERAAPLAETNDPDVQRLRTVRAEKAAAPISPALAAAKREFDAYQASLKAGGKPGRPKLSTRRREPDPEMPGRPEWLTPPTPPAEPREAIPPRATIPSPSTITMPKGKPSGGTWTKTCQRSGREFQATGAAAKYCGKCDECKAADAPASKRNKPAKVDKPRNPVRTGYQGVPPRSTPAAPSSGLACAIDEIRTELTTLDARRAELREQLREALASLQELADA